MSDQGRRSVLGTPTTILLVPLLGSAIAARDGNGSPGQEPTDDEGGWRPMQGAGPAPAIRPDPATGVVSLEGVGDHRPEILARADDILQRVALFVGHRAEGAVERQLGVAEDRRDPAPELIGEVSASLSRMAVMGGRIDSSATHKYNPS